MQHKFLGVQWFYIMILFLWVVGAGLFGGPMAAYWIAFSLWSGAQIWEYGHDRS